VKALLPLLLLAALLLPERAAGAPRSKKPPLDLMARKPDPPTPSPAASHPRPVKGRRLARGVNQAVENHRPAFQACIEKVAKRGTRRKVSAHATLVLTVRPDGVVSDARVREAYLRQRPLGQCLVDASYRMSFPVFEGKPMRVDLPLALTAE
jgi:hypothetical protein